MERVIRMNKMLISAIAFIKGNLMTSLFLLSRWLNLYILLVLLLIQFINLVKVAENKNTCRVSIQIKF